MNKFANKPEIKFSFGRRSVQIVTFPSANTYDRLLTGTLPVVNWCWCWGQIEKHQFCLVHWNVGFSIYRYTLEDRASRCAHSDIVNHI